MTKDEALKLALDFIEWSEGGTADLEAHIKEALAQTQEPVDDDIASIIACRNMLDAQPVQRTWVGLTDDEQQQAYEQWQNDGWGVFYNAIEAKLKEKNT